MNIRTISRHVRRALLVAWSCGGMLILASPDALAGQQDPDPQDIRYVVIHRPGPAWQAGKRIFDQEGVREHIAHYRQWLEAGKLELGGPYLDPTGGGMMIPAAGVPEEEVRQFANDDPAVKAGLLEVEVRPWLVGMSAHR